MRLTGLNDVKPRPRRVALGEFDGVHVGHREVIAGCDTVLTFEPHPAVVLTPERAPKLLTDLERKAELIAELDVAELVVVPFDERFARQPPSEFIDQVLVKRLGASSVSVGVNFRFGHAARGDASLLAADPRFATRVADLVELDGEPVSSSRIRRLVAEGAVADAARLLGRPFSLRGVVLAGDRRGRELGFPTANLACDPQLACPAYGVYACRAGEHAAAVSVGVRPTFGAGGQPLVEAFLIDYEGDLYGQRLTVDFVARLRDEQQFASAGELVQQMRRDVERTRELLASVPT